MPNVNASHPMAQSVDDPSRNGIVFFPLLLHETDMPAPLFSIFIATYNRATLIERAIQSLVEQRERDFEVVIVDDGSRDGTRDVIERWKRRGDFPIVYHYQENSGKHAAHNAALPLLRGELTVVLDSDDCLAPDALGIFRRHWEAIPAAERARYAGIEGLCAFLSNGLVAGDRYPKDVFDSDYITLRFRYHKRGDKKAALRTALLRQHPYPVFPGERHIRPSILWKRIAHHYCTRHVNEIVQLIEYQPDGLSSDRFSLRMKNPNGFRFYYAEDTDRHQPTWRGRLDSGVKYVRYAFHSGVGLRRQWLGIRRRGVWLIALPVGYLKYLRDRRRLGRQPR
ncbi:MAG: glycosyltransferase family 2 protein [Nitrococcus sp.]|nr:glycosyltransferase family 2 protein [Nitrococcus sp.]